MSHIAQIVIPIPPEPYTVLDELMQQRNWFDKFTGDAKTSMVGKMSQ